MSLNKTGAVTIDLVELAPTDGEQYREELQKHVYEHPKVPTPIYRHAAPSAPWPWMDLHDDDSDVNPLPAQSQTDDAEWAQYPQSLFGNWTQEQVKRCRILEFAHDETCSIYGVDIFHDGSFYKPSHDSGPLQVNNPRDYWNHLEPDLPLTGDPSRDIRVRALFVDNMTVPVLQILGTRYNVEPFFFASSANWIPSRYEEDPKEAQDHITVVLPFIRMLKGQKPIERAELIRTTTFALGHVEEEHLPYQSENQIIDTQAPLLLPDNNILFHDLLAIHMYRKPTTSTLISYHPSSELQGTSAKRLQSLAQRTGDSVYWSKIYARSKDPTFFFLAILWYPLYEWDEAFEALYRYINALESDVLKQNDLQLTRELHKLQAHLLYFEQLLRDFRMSVEFVKDTPNPAMSILAATEEERDDTLKLMEIETGNLLSEIERLSGQREMLSERLRNVIDLAFASVNIQDSRAAKKLAERAVIDSSVIKQISYLGLIFVPADFLSNAFAMNIPAIVPGTKGHIASFLGVSFGLTVFTTWVVVALQAGSMFHPKRRSIWRRCLWPVFYPIELIYASIEKRVQSAKK